MKLKTLMLFAMFLVCAGANAQRTEQTDTLSDKVYNVVDEMPSYPGGTGLLMKYLSTQIRYPADAMKNRIEGRVVVSFVVEKDGTVSNVACQKRLYPSIDAEAVRVVKKMAKWKPGRQNGVPVKVKYMLPVRFSLPK